MNLHFFFLEVKQRRQMEAKNAEKNSGLVLDNGQKKKGEDRLCDNWNSEQTKNSLNPIQAAEQKLDDDSSGLFYGSSWRLSCSSTEQSVNLLASDDDNTKIEEKSEEKSERKSLLTIPIEINIEKNLPPGIVEDEAPPQSSDDDNVTINLLEEELQEREAKRKREEEIIKVMMINTPGYPGSEELVQEEVNPPQPEMGTVCVWCGEEPCEWTRYSKAVTEYYTYEVETSGPDRLPPHNIMRKRMYRQVAIMQGFIRREKLPFCIHKGIRVLSPSPDGNYMGHKYVWNDKRVDSTVENNKSS
jgi:hypothetical protein